MRSDFEKAYEPKVLKIVKFDESVNAFVLLDHLDLTEINLNALAEINYGWALWQHQQSKVDELQKRVDSALKVVQSMRNEVKHGHLSDDESQTLSGYANDLEQALKGEQFEEHREKAEQAISNGASLTSHRIEL